MKQSVTNTTNDAFEEVDEAVQHLYDLVHRRWHPRSEEQEKVLEGTPKDVCDALEDLREITRAYFRGESQELRVFEAEASPSAISGWCQTFAPYCRPTIPGTRKARGTPGLPSSSSATTAIQSPPVSG